MSGSDADRAWRASSCYTDMTAALLAHGFLTYAEAVPLRHSTDRVALRRWREFNADWSARMRARAGMPVSVDRTGGERESGTRTSGGTRGGRVRHRGAE